MDTSPFNSDTGGDWPDLNSPVDAPADAQYSDLRLLRDPDFQPPAQSSTGGASDDNSQSTSPTRDFLQSFKPSPFSLQPAPDRSPDPFHPAKFSLSGQDDAPGWLKNAPPLSERSNGLSDISNPSDTDPAT